MFESCSCTFSKRSWILRPKWRTRIDTRTRGRRATPRRAGLIIAMRAMVPTHVASVFAVYMIPGPSTMRTADMSLVARLMMSPTRWVW